jgi:hypothetical protein
MVSKVRDAPNKALHLIPVNVVKIRDYHCLSRMESTVLKSWGAGELGRWAATQYTQSSNVPLVIYIEE